jgi:hypothetical protein
MSDAPSQKAAGSIPEEVIDFFQSTYFIELPYVFPYGLLIL